VENVTLPSVDEGPSEMELLESQLGFKLPKGFDPHKKFNY